MLGGGQLGRMFIFAAKQMGYHTVVLTGDAADPAAQISDEVIIGDFRKPQLQELAERCDVVTLEFENIPTAAVEIIAAMVPTHPKAEILRVAQDRCLEKTTLRDFGLPVTPFRIIDGPSSPAGRQAVGAAIEEFGYPVVMKLATSGYDGRGQIVVRSADQLSTALAEFGSQRLVVEQWIAYDAEISTLVARNQWGEMVVYPILENRHQNNILQLSFWPSQLPVAIQEAAQYHAQELARRLNLVGILCVEWFVVGEDLLLNEMAPRPHNSGHLTIEAATTHQFEQHLRAVCGLPLGSPQPRCPAAMFNLLGELWQSSLPAFDAALRTAGVSLHLYGKTEPRPGRKMGHLTAVAADTQQAIQRVTAAYAALKT